MQYAPVYMITFGTTAPSDDHIQLNSNPKNQDDESELC